jgi:hypothetical protein
MDIGLGMRPDVNGKMIGVMEMVDSESGFTCAFTGEDNYAHDIDEIIRGLKQLKNDFAQLKSGLIQAKGGLPDGFAQGGKQPRPRGTG